MSLFKQKNYRAQAKDIESDKIIEFCITGDQNIVVKEPEELANTRT